MDEIGAWSGGTRQVISTKMLPDSQGPTFVSYAGKWITVLSNSQSIYIHA